MAQHCLTAPLFGKNETIVSFEIIWCGRKFSSMKLGTGDQRLPWAKSFRPCESVIARMTAGFLHDDRLKVIYSVWLMKSDGCS